ncbi:MAG: META domain-containing protein [Mediterranea sp.]|nr:META domain-containing protein [Mediterranea sp.]
MCMALAAFAMSSCRSADQTASLSAINGEWNIVKVNGQAVPAGEGNQPFIGFDVQKKAIHGNAGCNRMGGEFTTAAKNAISFSRVVTTKMACLNMTAEDRVLKALNAVQSYKVLRNGDVSLLDNSKKQVLLLEKKK